jgi:hypothetical protein
MIASAIAVVSSQLAGFIEFKQHIINELPQPVVRLCHHDSVLPTSQKQGLSRVERQAPPILSHPYHYKFKDRLRSQDDVVTGSVAASKDSNAAVKDSHNTSWFVFKFASA